jgi:hypothetical protein
MRHKDSYRGTRKNLAHKLGIAWSSMLYYAPHSRRVKAAQANAKRQFEKAQEIVKDIPVATIPLPEPKAETPVPKQYAKAPVEKPMRRI